MNDNQPNLSLRQLFEHDVYKVPVYQRNYDWGEPQIQQLVEDINDFAQAGDASVYYIGSLVVHEKTGYFEVLDGQQRFTTLTLLICYLKYRLPAFFTFYKKPNLEFESRPKSENSLKKLYEVVSSSVEVQGRSHEALLAFINGINLKDVNPSIVNGFKIISRVMASSVESQDDDEQLKTFAQYLLTQVKILRVHVPKNTDVTHYFEVMNNRGEQLEKHEIVKANLLSTVQDSQQDMAIIQKIWLACSDMSRYAQTNFSVAERQAIFEDNCEGFTFNSFNTLRDAIYTTESTQEESTCKKRETTFTLEESLELGQKAKADHKPKGDDDGREERFTSVIDFPNFLMQILRLYVKKHSTNALPPLDDKALIKSFKAHIGNDSERAKAFVFTLLKYRYLFDRFIVKRERASGEEDWSLKRYKLNEGNVSYVNTFGEEDNVSGTQKSCMMLLSAFHVSYPTNSRKNWLSAVLYWIDEKVAASLNISANSYLKFLENLAHAFMLNRYLTNMPIEYEHFIYSGIEKLSSNIAFKSEFLSEMLSYGRIRAFAFNYVDYCLWKDTALNKANKTDFRFSANKSIEHFSPQTPKANERLNTSALHSFGNLCLLASSDNSSLSNDGPEQKAKILNARRKIMAPLSLKLELMLEQADAWSKSAEESAITIQEHETQMFKVLADNLNLSIDAEL